MLRVPDSDDTVSVEDLLPSPQEFKDLVLRQLGSTSLFAAKFREAAGRALLLPKRRPGVRAPLWQQRKRSADLLAVASRFPSFPILLETYRDCIRDVFDLPAVAAILAGVQRGSIRVTNLETNRPSPFAASLLFSYVANYIYDGDAPLAERRAQALSIDQSQLEELLGDSDLRELLDETALNEVEARLQSLDPEYQAKHTDGLHDLLLKLGDLTADEVGARSENTEVAARISELIHSRRAVLVRIASESRYIPVEYAARYRDALGTPLPPGLAEVFLEKNDDPLRELARTYARTHGPFTTPEFSLRYGLAATSSEAIFRALHGDGKLLEGAFRPGGVHREWCDPGVLQQMRRKSLARLRREIEPAEQTTFARLMARWQGVSVRRRGFEALLDTIENLQGAALLASELEREILPARIADYRSTDLDTLMASGQVVWVGVDRIGNRDGRVALYLRESLPLLLRPKSIRGEAPAYSERAAKIAEFLKEKGASFFAALQVGVGGGFPGDTREALWELVWSGEVTNDTFHPLRDLLRSGAKNTERTRIPFGSPPGSPEFMRRFRSRNEGPVQGRWSLVEEQARPQNQADGENGISPTEWSANIAQQLLVRHGIVLRETAIAENIPRGYPTIYPALKLMEDSGWVRRGMFVAGLGAAQFAMPAAVDMLRSLRAEPETPEVIFLAATDPANPYGTILPWPRRDSDGSPIPAEEQNGAEPAVSSKSEELLPTTRADPNTGGSRTLSRTSGAGVILINGVLVAFFRRRSQEFQVFLPESEPTRSRYARELARQLADVATRRRGSKLGLLVGTIDGAPAREHFLSGFLVEAGFTDSALGFQLRRVGPLTMAPIGTETKIDPQTDLDDDDAEVSEIA